jgi:hypothetical protein
MISGLRDRRPLVAGIAEAVQQHDRATGAVDAHVERRVTGLDHFHLERRWKRPDPRRGRVDPTGQCAQCAPTGRMAYS